MIIDALNRVSNKDNFLNLTDYFSFATYFLDYVENHKQATIVSQNENVYNFFQYDQTADFQITRPFNSRILYSSEELQENSPIFLQALNDLRKYREGADIQNREVINRTVYTLQQAIGFALDALPAGKSNNARKLNGDYFESLILLLLQSLELNVDHGTLKVPVTFDGEELFKMKYQQDLIVRDSEGEINLIGSVKTTSKDRITKIFTDKFLYSKLTETAVPHIAIFLHDVQRANSKSPQKYKVNSTFLTNHFKGLTVKLNPLDGVYYFDPRPNMQSDVFLSERIQTFDHLLCEDIWEFIN
jgi:hypothetical protein